jgi:hypothetical protein
LIKKPITLFEHDSLSINDKCDVINVLPSLYRLLGKIKCDEALYDMKSKLCSNSFVGILRVRNIIFEIIPKIGKEINECIKNSKSILVLV